MDDEALQEHVALSEEMRTLYNGMCESTTGWERDPSTSLLRPHLVPSTDLLLVLDFAQDILLPQRSRATKMEYFSSSLRVSLFGVGSPSLGQQRNYLVAEGEYGTRDGAGSCKTPSHVASMLHDALACWVGTRARRLVIFSDNAPGQQKNYVFLAYLMWRVAMGLNERILLRFFEAGHSKNYCDSMFGCIKRKLVRSDVYSMTDLCRVVSESAEGNCYVLPTREFVWSDWATHLTPNIKKFGCKIIDKHAFDFFSANSIVDVYGNSGEGEPVERGPVLEVTSAFLRSVVPQMEYRLINDERAELIVRDVFRFVPEDKRKGLCLRAWEWMQAKRERRGERE
jgi:hypothetical protein